MGKHDEKPEASNVRQSSAPAPLETAALKSSEVGPVEVRVLSAGTETSAVYEIWTEHTVFEFDQSLRCIAVRDADTGEPKVGNPCLGARLIGGRHAHDQSVDISSPLPAVGHKALLGGDGHAMTMTTPVTRVVMNLWRWSSSPPPAAGGGA